MFQRQIYDICQKIWSTIKFMSILYCSAVLRSEIGKPCFCSIHYFYCPITNVSSVRVTRVSVSQIAHLQTFPTTIAIAKMFDYNMFPPPPHSNHGIFCCHPFKESWIPLQVYMF
jgi:hypothetical protein